MTSQNKILLVEDAPAMQAIVQSLLAPVAHVKCVSTLKEAESEISQNEFSLMILDVVLPDGDGFDFCQKLRARESLAKLPIIFLTSKDDVEDRVRGFKIGADDYVVKPLEPNEFIARVEAKLRRSAVPPGNGKIEKGPFLLDVVSQTAFLKTTTGTDNNLRLTPIEYKLLAHFLTNDDRVYSRESLKSLIWGPTVHLSDHTVDTHVSSLRKKINPHSGCLRAVVKQGYTFSLTPKRADEGSKS